MFGLGLWYINSYSLFDAKPYIYIYIYIYIYNLVRFYGILTTVGYLMPNPVFTYIQ